MTRKYRRNLINAMRCPKCEAALFGPRKWPNALRLYRCAECGEKTVTREVIECELVEIQPKRL